LLLFATRKIFFFFYFRFQFEPDCYTYKRQSSNERLR